MTIPLGYCTNVHAGADLGQTRANLQRYALAVKKRVSPGAPMGVGLWLSARSARQLVQERRVEEWADWLAEVGLVPYTFNGFPHGDFHEPVVKHKVYLPRWSEAERADYTRVLIGLQHRLLPAGLEGTISTLPIAWGQPRPAEEALQAAGAHLYAVAETLHRLEKETGRLISLCLEPEPGCVLQRSGDVVAFYEKYLLPGRDEHVVRRYLRVCHDVCHAAVMFEEQPEVLRCYHRAGIAVGKIQISSAVCLPLQRLPPGERAAAVAQLAGFNENRYLHQTSIRMTPDSEPVFYEDLHMALKQEPVGEWRVHFHVPIYLERFGRLEATQGAILDCLRTAHELAMTAHLEVETYAWGVLPAELRQPDLAGGIAQELLWLLRAYPNNPQAR
jgi:hypothetical protein